MTHRAPQHRARAFVALLLAVIAALTLAACGGDDTSGSGGGGDDKADARTLLNETFSGTKDVRSGRVALSLGVRAEGETIALSVDGPFENAGSDAYPKFDLAIEARLGSQGSYSAGLTSTSDRLYVAVEGQSYELPAELLRQQASRGGADRLSIPDLDPQSWIDDPQVAGEESVGGAETYHVTGKVDVPAFLDSVDKVLAEADRQGLSGATGGQLPRSIPSDARADIERAIRGADVDVWTGKDDKTLRKLQVEVAVEPRAGRSGTASFVLELSDLNAPQTIEPPARTRPLNELLSGLGALLGSSSLGGGSGPAAGADDYARCLAEAGADVEKAQKCEGLLGG